MLIFCWFCVMLDIGHPYVQILSNYCLKYLVFSERVTTLLDGFDFNVALVCFVQMSYIRCRCLTFVSDVVCPLQVSQTFSFLRR